MNIKHVVLGVSSIVVALVLTMVVISAYPLIVEDVLSPGDEFFPALVLGAAFGIVGSIGLIVANLIAAVGWLTDRFSRARLHRVSRIGIVSGLLFYISESVAFLSLDFLLDANAAAIMGVLVLPLAVGAWLTRPEQPLATEYEEPGEKQGRPSA